MANSELFISELKSGCCRQTIVAPHLANGRLESGEWRKVGEVMSTLIQGSITRPRLSTILDPALRHCHIFSLNSSLPGSPIKISCLRADQGQLSKLLEKERQRMHKSISS
ncbi:hypothetical protein YC2023_118323 [Brassica napus]